MHCRVCGRHIDEAGPLSARGKCEDCGVAGVEAAVTAMYSGTGEIYERWARNTAAGLLRAVDRSRSPEGGG